MVDWKKKDDQRKDKAGNEAEPRRGPEQSNPDEGGQQVSDPPGLDKVPQGQGYSDAGKGCPVANGSESPERSTADGVTPLVETGEPGSLVKENTDDASHPGKR